MSINTTTERRRARRWISGLAAAMFLSGVVAGATISAASAASPSVPRAHALKRGSVGSASTPSLVSYNGGRTLHHVKIVGAVWGTGTYLPELQAPTPPSVAAIDPTVWTTR